MKKYQIKYGKKIITYTLHRNNRKSLKINVLPDLSVEIIAPEKIPLKKIKEKTKKRAAWIIKQINYFSEFPPPIPPRKYISGETHRYLGRQYRLKIIKSTNNDVKMDGPYIKIFIKYNQKTDYKKSLLNKWYRNHALIKFEELINKAINKLRKYNIQEPVMTIKNMSKRWGSCSPDKNKIILNDILVKVPTYCIEYVIYHELCHLKYPIHDKRYYNFLSLVMPDWKERKKKLEHVEI